MQQIRLTPTSFIVLGLLAEAGEATPYELKQAVAAGLGNFWSLQHAQLYSEPERLAGAGYLEESREQAGRRRRHYRLTQRGRDALREWLGEPTAALTELRDVALLKLFFGADPSALAPLQLEAHRAKLAEYEQFERAAAGAPPGALATLRAGLAHEREWVRYWASLANGAQPGDARPHRLGATKRSERG